MKLCECGCGQPTTIARKTVQSAGWIKGEGKRFIHGHHANVPSNRAKLEQAKLKALTKHGMAHSVEYGAFRAAKYRCTNPKDKAFPDYGGRGIKFLFTSFDQFMAELGSRPTPEHSLDRINNDGNYEPGNVRWATKKEQTYNRRNTPKVPPLYELMAG